MAREVSRLSARLVASDLAPGTYFDGQNLYLQVSDSGTKSWLFRYGYLGGESGIRTHGTLLTYTRFPSVRLKPLGHLSAALRF